MTNPNSPIFTYANRLFARGIETYDSENNRQVNAGGAQAYQLIGWKKPTSPIGFNDEKFGNVLRDIGATLYSLNRIDLDAEGKPRKIPGTNRNRRTDSGLMLYMQFGENGNTAREAVARIAEACPDLKDNIAAVVDLIESVPTLTALNEVSLPRMTDYEPIMFMNPLKAIILAIPSGSQNSNQRWFYKSTLKDRKGLDESRKVVADTSDLV